MIRALFVVLAVLPMLGFSSGLAIAQQTLSSIYLFRGEMKTPRGLLSTKLFVTSTITFLFGTAMVVGSIVYLAKGLRL